MQKFAWVLLLVSFSIVGCKSEKASDSKVEKASSFLVFDGDIKEDRKAYTTLNLDDTCPNLLDPRISKDDIANINKAWLDLNQNLGAYLSKNEFSWNTSGPNVKVWHKFYFHKDGALKAYLFKVQDKEVTKEARASYKALMLEFSKTYQLPLTKESTFAQCGKGVFEL